MPSKVERLALMIQSGCTEEEEERMRESLRLEGWSDHPALPHLWRWRTEEASGRPQFVSREGHLLDIQAAISYIARNSPPYEVNREAE